MGLPFKPEPFDKLKKRFPEALKHVWNTEAVISAKGDHPNFHRCNVFDFDSMVRMCSYVEHAPDVKEKVLHVSIGCFEGADLSVMQETYNFILLAFVGNRKRLDFTMDKSRCISHFFYEFEPSVRVPAICAN